MKLYVASSWRNPHQPDVVAELRKDGHEVYDFRNPAPGNTGFAWSEIDPDWRAWDAAQYREALYDPIAEDGFAHDWNAMEWADGCVLVLPSGRSAHLEAGYFVGAGKPLFILMLGENDPELMYKMARAICLEVDELLIEIYDADLYNSDPEEEQRRCRECGCTDYDCSECVERTGEPCYWVEDDLCSACAEAPA